MTILRRISSESFHNFYSLNPIYLQATHNAAGFPESLSDETLAPLKTYKYSSVDKSFTSRFILKHYVPGPHIHPLSTDTNWFRLVVECRCRVTPPMARPKYGHIDWIHVHCRELDCS